MKHIPYIQLGITEQEYENSISPLLKEIFIRGDFVGGGAVAEFESAFAEYCGCRYAATVNSGTDALELALEVHGIGHGDEVITVGNSFIATTNAISRLGAVPVLADIGRDLLINPDDIECRITKKTKAILPVHLTGLVCEMDKICDIASKYGLVVIEDAAQSVGSTYRSRFSGNLGDTGCFSLHPLKNLAGIGDGGIVTTNSKDEYELICSIRNHGIVNRDHQKLIGRVSRLDTLNAVILLHRLGKLDSIVSERQRKAALYNKLLKDTKGISIYSPEQHRIHTYHVYIIQAERRQELIKHLETKGIQTKIHYPLPAYKQPCFRGVAENLPMTDILSEKILSLPIAITSEEEIEYIAEQINNFYSGKA